MIITILLYYLIAMRRKSERNKAKGSPEKKVEKPTRKSTRRRGRRSPSTSSEQDTLVEDTTKNVTQVTKEIEKETSMQTRLQSKELEQIPHGREEKVSSSERDIKADSPEDEEDNSGSVWKVARADASPGEIQKLKLCRQRNTSEVSSETAVSSRKGGKSSGKWQESGEGVVEEADSADEQLVSCTRMLSSTEQPNASSSSYPGQDSNEEVSDSKETLPETTSANLLSDDKPNIDPHGESNEANCAAQYVDSEPGKPGTTTASTPSANGDYSCEKTVAATAADTIKEEKSVEDASEKSIETFNKGISIENVHKDTSSEDEEGDKAKIQHPMDSSSDSNDESRPKRSRTSSDRTSPRAIRRKHRNKYRDSSNSETPDSEDESIDRKVSESYMEEREEEEKPNIEQLEENDKERSILLEKTNTHSNNVEKMEIEHCETIKIKLEENMNEKSEQIILASNQIVIHKPVKVNLKRSL